MMNCILSSSPFSFPFEPAIVIDPIQVYQPAANPVISEPPCSVLALCPGLVAILTRLLLI